MQALEVVRIYRGLRTGDRFQNFYSHLRSGKVGAEARRDFSGLKAPLNNAPPSHPGQGPSAATKTASSRWVPYSSRSLTLIFRNRRTHEQLEVLVSPAELQRRQKLWGDPISDQSAQAAIDKAGDAMMTAAELPEATGISHAHKGGQPTELDFDFDGKRISGNGLTFVIRKPIKTLGDRLIFAAALDKFLGNRGRAEKLINDVTSEVVRLLKAGYAFSSREPDVDIGVSKKNGEKNGDWKIQIGPTALVKGDDNIRTVLEKGPKTAEHSWVETMSKVPVVGERSATMLKDALTSTYAAALKTLNETGSLSTLQAPTINGPGLSL